MNKTPDFVQRILDGEVVVDIGQIPTKQKRRIRRLVKKGEVEEFPTHGYPLVKTGFVLKEKIIEDGGQ